MQREMGNNVNDMTSNGIPITKYNVVASMTEPLTRALQTAVVSRPLRMETGNPLLCLLQCH